MLGVLLGFLIVVPASPVAAFGGGAGTSGDPYQIATCAHLLEIDDTTANLSKSYLLTANINCTGVSITPMQNGSTYFSGVLDGGSKTISNVSLTCASANCGLFSRLAGATVKDLTLASFTVSSTYDNVGALAGNSSGTVTLTNLVVSGVNVSGANTVAGVISTCGVCIIDNVDVSGSVTASGDYAAGIVANFGSNTVHASVVNDSSSSVTVSGGSNVGGLIGYGIRSSYDATKGVFRSSFTGSVTGSGTNKFGAGGIAGYTWNIAVADSWSSGSVSGVDQVGGITGYHRNLSTIKKSYSSGSLTSTTVSCSAGAGGIAGSSEGSISESYSVASITAVCRSGGVAGTLSGSISDSFFRGSLTRTSGTDASFGGVIGRGNGSITNSYAATTNSYAYGWGLAGDNQFAPLCTSAYWDTTTSGRSSTYCSAGATGKTTAQMKTQATFSGWDFSTIWNIDPSTNGGYPFLRNVAGPASDGTAPTLSSAELMANGTKLVLTFNEALHATTAPASAFTVTASAVLITPSAAAVNGSTVELTLPSVLESSATITVAYVAPAANAATSNAAVQDTAGNDAASFSGRPVTNSSTADGTAPTASWTPPTSPSSSMTLTYTLTFSEPVTGIDAADFRVVGNTSCTSITPSAASTASSITVTVVCTVDGLVILALRGNTVLDASSNTGPVSDESASGVTISSPSTTTVPVNQQAVTTTTLAVTPPVDTSVSTTTTIAVSAAGGSTTAAPSLATDGDVATSVSEDFVIPGVSGTARSADGSIFSVSRTGAIGLKIRTGYIGIVSGTVKATYRISGRAKTWSCTVRSTRIGTINKNAKRSVGNWFPKKLYTVANKCVVPAAMRTALKSQKVVITSRVRFVKQWPTTGKPINALTNAKIPVGTRVLRVTIGK